jgi:hypothetical protein
MGPEEVNAIIAAALSFALVLWTYKSVFFLRPNHALEVYLVGGNHFGTYFARSLRETLTSQQQRKFDRLSRKRFGRTSLNIIILPWPLFFVVRFTTTNNKVMLHAGDIYTKTVEGFYYRVNLHADPTMWVRFLTLRHMMPAIEKSTLVPMWNVRLFIDLTKACDIPIYGLSPTPAEQTEVRDQHTRHTYKDTYLALILMHTVQEAFLEALRKAASYFTWDGDEDIAKDKPLIGFMILYIMATDEGVLPQAKVLERPYQFRHIPSSDLKNRLKRLSEGNALRRPQFTPNDLTGASVLSVEVVVEGLTFAKFADDTPDAAKAVNAPFVAAQDRRSEAERGRGRAAAAKAIRDELGVDPDVALIAERIDKDVPLSVNMLGGDLQQFLQRLTGKKGD